MNSKKITVRFTIKGDAPAEKLREIVEQQRARSAVTLSDGRALPALRSIPADRRMLSVAASRSMWRQRSARTSPRPHPGHRQHGPQDHVLRGPCPEPEHSRRDTVSPGVEAQPMRPVT